MPRSYTLTPSNGSRRPAAPAAPAARRAPHRYPGHLAGPLSNVQKAQLCIACREAFDQRGGECKLGPLDEWRHEQVRIATGKPGLTACAQGDYKKLLAHFLMLKGETGRAMNAHLDDSTEERRVAAYKLQSALQKAGLTPSYAEAICKRQFRTTVAECSAKQLWNLFYTITNRATARRQKAQSAK